MINCEFLETRHLIMTRSQKHVYLLGTTISEFTGSKLPSLRMVLGLFLHRHNDLSETIRESSNFVVSEIGKFYQKARIPMRDSQNCQTKVEKVFEEWRHLKKNKGRQSATQKKKESEFISRLEDLFDVAHTSALCTMTIAEDREFLLAQRQKGRRGSIAGIDTILAKKEKTAALRMELVAQRHRRMENLQKWDNTTAVLASSRSSAEDTADENEVAIRTSSTPNSGQRKRKRGRTIVVTPELAVALDRTKVSNRKAAFVIAEIAKSLGHNIDNLALNEACIRRQRMVHRKEISAKLKTEFHGDVPLVVHWDGKLLPDLTEKKKIDRLPVLVSGKGVSQLLTVAKLPSGTGEAQAEAVHGALKDWGIEEKVRAMCFDTTRSNTGRNMGACVQLEHRLGKKILALACRHHIMELIIGTVFKVCMGSSSSPEILLFKRFQASWINIDKAKFEIGMNNDYVARLLLDVKGSILDFANTQLENIHPRDDYREFCELVVIFLGGVPSRGLRFMAPGAIHQARWISKVIFSLKVWMFRSQFKLTAKEERGLRDLCVFAIRVYLKAWMTAPLAANAPYNDLNLLKTLLQYSSINVEISKAASQKLAKHLWYLSEDLIALALFDGQVSPSTKKLIVKAMYEEEGEEDPPKRITVALETFREKSLPDFVTKRSIGLFERMDLPDTFLHIDPEMWDNHEDFKKAQDIVLAMQVVNDHAERGVALIQEFSGLLTKSEPQLQFLLQVVQEHRKTFPDSRKQTLIGNTCK